MRERRNFDNLASSLEFIGPGEVIGINGDGFFTLNLATAGGLENASGELQINLDTDPGLALAAGGLSVLVQGVLDIDASGVFVPIGNGLENDTGALAVSPAASGGLTFSGGGDLLIDLDTNPGLQLAAGGLSVLPNGSSLTLGASGLSVTAPEGAPVVTAVQTGVYTAALGELVRYDASGGTFAINLPTAAGHNRVVEFKETANDATGVTIAADGAETIDGSGTLGVSAARAHTRLVSDGTNWMIA